MSRVVSSTTHLTTTISRHGNGIALTAGRSSIIMHQDTLNNLVFQYCGSAQRKSTSGCIDKTAKALLAVTISSLANNVTWVSPMPHDIDSILPRADLHIPTFAVSSVVGHSTVLYHWSNLERTATTKEIFCVRALVLVQIHTFPSDMTDQHFYYLARGGCSTSTPPFLRTKKNGTAHGKIYSLDDSPVGCQIRSIREVLTPD